MNNTRSVMVNFQNGNSTQKITFHESKSIDLPSLKGLDSDLMEKIHQTHIKILPYEKNINHWISISEKNGQFYLKNPIQALESANLGIPKDLLNELKIVSQLILTTLKK